MPTKNFQLILALEYGGREIGQTLNELSRSVFLASDSLERNRQPRHAAGAAGCVNALRQFGLAPARNDPCVDFASVDVCRCF